MTVAACVSLEEHMHPLVILTQTLRHREVGCSAQPIWRQRCLSAHALGTRPTSHVTCLCIMHHFTEHCNMPY